MKITRIHRLWMLTISLSLWAFLLLTVRQADAQPDGEIVGTPAFAPLRLPTNLKVILVQFADVKWDQYKNSSGVWTPYDRTHKKSDFEALLASLGTYQGTNADLETVHGSLRDYFNEMSRGYYSFMVSVLNNTDANGYPIWVTLSNNKSTYDTFSFTSAAISAANAAGLSTSHSASEWICFIYAGNWDPGILMATLGGAYNREIMVVPERNNADRTDFEFATDKLIHIGTFCHEFVHMMGTDHTAVTTYRWALMREGSKNGDVFGNRPASMNPWFLYQAGWQLQLEFRDMIPTRI